LGESEGKRFKKEKGLTRICTNYAYLFGCKEKKLISGARNQEMHIPQELRGKKKVLELFECLL
jgi:hypothetical protein